MQEKNGTVNKKLDVATENGITPEGDKDNSISAFNSTVYETSFVENANLLSPETMPEVVVNTVSTTIPIPADSPANDDASSGSDDDISRSGSKVKPFYRVKRGAEIATEKVRQGCGAYWSETCSVDTVKQRLPIINWLPKYRMKTLKSDLIAGLTVGLTVIPQGMAYAALAGLELQFGLYSAFMGCFIYCLMGTSKDITMGPTAIMSILVAEYAHDPWSKHGNADEETTNVTLAILLTFMCGLIQILMTIFKLGFLVRYISHPVITGFTSAASIVIATTQLKKIFGIITPRGFFLTVYTIFKDIKTTKVFDLAMGLTCMIVLYLLKYSKERWSKPKEGDKIPIRILRKILWFTATSRNAFVVVICGAIAYGVTDRTLPVDERPLTLTKNITGGLPPFQLPALEYDVPHSNQTVFLGEMLSQLGSGLFMVPLIGFLESIAIAKAFGRKNNYKVDPSQELLSIGVGNFLSSFVSSYPITGSFGRSAVNAQSNVMTPLGGIFTGAVVLLALQFLSDAFQFIPAAALGAVIIMAVINLFDFSAMKHVWHVKKLDIVPLIVTFGLCFWDIAWGILAGIGVSLLILLMGHARPKAKTTRVNDIVTISLKRGLVFPGAEYIEDKLQEQADQGDCKVVIVDCTNITTLDYSAAESFYHGSEALKKADISLKLTGLTVGQEKMMKNAGLLKFDVRFYDTVEEAMLDILPPSEQV